MLDYTYDYQEFDDGTLDECAVVVADFMCAPFVEYSGQTCPPPGSYRVRNGKLGE